MQRFILELGRAFEATDIVQRLAVWIPNVISALIILALFYVAWRLARRGADVVIRRSELDPTADAGAVGEGDGVGTTETCTESFHQTAGISFARLSYSTYSPVKLMALASQGEPTTSKCISDRYPEPLTPGAPGTLLTMRTVPCTPSGTSPQPSTGMELNPITPSVTSVTMITSGSYVTS